MYYAIYQFLYHLCGQSDKIVRETKITQLSENEFHLQYDEFLDEIDLKVRITKIYPTVDYAVAEHEIYQYEVYDSVYGDDGTVTLDIVVH